MTLTSGDFGGNGSQIVLRYVSILPFAVINWGLGSSSVITTDKENNLPQLYEPNFIFPCLIKILSC